MVHYVTVIFGGFFLGFLDRSQSLSSNVVLKNGQGVFILAVCTKCILY